MHNVPAPTFETASIVGRQHAGPLRPALRAYDRSKLLISLHIPKTAGTSFCTSLRSWFGADRLHLHYRGSATEPAKHTAVGAGDCIHGHFNRARGIGALTYYPEATQFITFLRDPFARFVSQWRYLHFQRRNGVAVPALDDNPTFDQWFKRRAEATSAGEDPFSFLAQLPWPVSRDHSDTTFNQGYIAVGILEDYEASVRVMARALGFPQPQATIHVNRDDDAHRLGEAFALEYAVYEAGRRHLNGALGRGV